MSTTRRAKNGTRTTYKKDDGGQAFMRSVSVADRNRLTQGKLVDILDHRGVKIGEIPHALFNAASTQPDLVNDGAIVLPEVYDVQQTQRLLSKMLIIAKSPMNVELAPTDNIADDIHFHSVAEWLGMGSFTQNIFDVYFKAANQRVPSTKTIEILEDIHTPPGRKIFQQMAYHLATLYFEDKIVLRDDFERYLENHLLLKDAVMEVVWRKEAKAQVKAQKEEEDLAFRACERRRQERAKKDGKRSESPEEQPKENAVGAARQQERRKREAEVRKSMLEKKRLGQKLNLEEARMHEKVFGKPVPY